MIARRLLYGLRRKQKRFVFFDFEVAGAYGDNGASELLAGLGDGWTMDTDPATGDVLFLCDRAPEDALADLAHRARMHPGG